MKFELKKEIEVRGEKISSLELREPTGGDMIDSGFPFDLSLTAEKDLRTHYNTQAVSSLIVRLCNIPASSVRQIAPGDLLKLSGLLQSFFDLSPTTRETS